MPIQIEITSLEKSADDIRKIRQAVFVEEQGIDPALEWDELDSSAKFIIAKDSIAGPVGTARFFVDGNIGRMAVLEEWRNQGIGGDILATIIQHARSSNIHKLHLSAQQSAIRFYKNNDFNCQGAAYLEANIVHQYMIRAL